MKIILDLFKKKHPINESTLLREGGNMFKNANGTPACTKIHQENVAATMDEIYNKLVIPEFKLTPDVDTALLGSTGKKLPGGESGDIDLALDYNKLRENFDLPEWDPHHRIQEWADLAVEAGKKIGVDCHMVGSTLSLKWPIVNFDGKQEGEFVQLDLMPTDNLKLIRFGKFSQAEVEGEQFIKGKVRNIMMAIMVAQVYHEDLTEETHTYVDDDGEEHEVHNEYINYTWDANTGIHKSHKKYSQYTNTRAGKWNKGDWKPHADVVESPVIANDPDEICEIVFGPGVKPEDIDTVQKMWKAWAKSPTCQKDPEALSKTKEAIDKSAANNPDTIYPDWNNGQFDIEDVNAIVNEARDPNLKGSLPVTNFVSEFFEKFDFNAWVARVAEKEGISLEEAKVKCLKTGVGAANYGTNVHKVAELALRGEPPAKVAKTEREMIVYSFIYEYAKHRAENFTEIHPEFVVKAKSNNIGGRIDALVKDADGWKIIDWKTDGKIADINYGGKVGIIDVLKTVSDNNFNHYALQLNVYEWILKDIGFIPKRESVTKELHWIKYNPGEEEAVTIEVLPLPNFQSVIPLMIENAIERGIIRSNEVMEDSSNKDDDNKSPVEDAIDAIPDGIMDDLFSSSTEAKYDESLAVAAPNKSFKTIVEKIDIKKSDEGYCVEFTSKAGNIFKTKLGQKGTFIENVKKFGKKAVWETCIKRKPDASYKAEFILGESIDDRHNVEVVKVNDLRILTEGGNMFNYVVRINQENVADTLDDIYTRLLPELHLDKSDVRCLGSTGKKLPGGTSGDIDLGMDKGKLESENNLTGDFKEWVTFAMDVGKKLGVDVSTKAHLVSLAWPIANTDGKQEDQFIQLDLMPFEDLEYADFAKNSHPEIEGELFVKARVRMEIMMCAFDLIDRQILKRGPVKGVGEDEPVEMIRYALNGDEGLNRKHIMRKPAPSKKDAGMYNKTWVTLEQELVTRSPAKIVELCFGKGVTFDEIKKPQDAWEYIKKTPLHDDPELWAEFKKLLVERWGGDPASQGINLPEDMAAELGLSSKVNEARMMMRPTALRKMLRESLADENEPTKLPFAPFRSLSQDEKIDYALSLIDSGREEWGSFVEKIDTVEDYKPGKLYIWMTFDVENFDDDESLEFRDLVEGNPHFVDYEADADKGITNGIIFNVDDGKKIPIDGETEGGGLVDEGITLSQDGKSSLTKDLTLEGGHIFNTVTRIHQENVAATLDDIYEKLLPELGLTKDDVAIHGSTGRRKPGGSSGDIDLGMDINKLDYQDWDHWVEVTKKIADKLGVDVNAVKAGNLVSFAWPIVPADGEQEGEFVQLDLMPTADLEFQTWTLQTRQEYEDVPYVKGVVRCSVLRNAAAVCDKQVLKRGPVFGVGEDAPVEWTAYKFDNHDGLLLQHFERKLKRNGQLYNKGAEVIDEKFITTDVRKICKTLFGKDIDPEEAGDPEEVWALAKEAFSDDLEKWEEFKKLEHDELIAAARHEDLNIPPEMAVELGIENNIVHNPKNVDESIAAASASFVGTPMGVEPLVADKFLWRIATSRSKLTAPKRSWDPDEVDIEEKEIKPDEK